MPISRRKRTEYLVMGTVVAGGVMAVLFWPRIKRYITSGTVIIPTSEITVKQSGDNNG